MRVLWVCACVGVGVRTCKRAWAKICPQLGCSNTPMPTHKHTHRHDSLSLSLSLSLTHTHTLTHRHTPSQTHTQRLTSQTKRHTHTRHRHTHHLSFRVSPTYLSTYRHRCMRREERTHLHAQTKAKRVWHRMRAGDRFQGGYNKACYCALKSA